METTKKTIIDNLEDRNINNMNTIAFESIGGSSIDYKTFFELVNVYVKGFKELGVQEGDMVTICSAGTLDTILNFAALNKMGAVSQFVNPNYFKFNSKKYINDTNSKLLICLDRFYPLIKNAIAETNVQKILLSSISEYSSLLFKVVARRKKVKDSDKIKNIKYIELPDFIKLGENSDQRVARIPYVPDRPSVVAYTSGTTGNPKGVIHSNDSINNMIMIYELANGIGASAGDRNLILIPPMYLTSLIHEFITPMSLGGTNILQPIYKPETFGKDILKYEPKATVGSKAHYLGLENTKYADNVFKFLKLPYCGGEAISYTTATRINRILNKYGASPLIIGYGQTEFGTMTMFNYGISDRTNESGILLPEIKAKILDLVSGKPVKNGERGELYIQTPAMMSGYINNSEATSKFFVFDENGERWAKTGDIAKVKYNYNGEDVYEVSGRRSDSFVDENGEVVYLFDIENMVEDIKYVNQAEVVSLTIGDKKVPIVHVVLDKNVKANANDVIKAIDRILKNNLDNKNSIPYAYKIRNEFDTSPISGKRDYEILKYETEGYVKVDDTGNISNIIIRSKESEEENALLKSKILVRK